MSAATGRFFAIGKTSWGKACRLGINPAVSLLTLAAGTGRDHRTTSWSAEAVFRYTGVSWRRARKAIADLETGQLVERLATGKRPRYRLAPNKPDDLIWLPNELITGAAGETPPVTLLRQTQEVEVLELFVNLYGEHDLTGDGGIPRELLYQPFERKHIMDYRQFCVYGFDVDENRYCNCVGPLAKYKGRDTGKAWDHLNILERLGLIEWVAYLAESGAEDAELIHALSGDSDADAVAEAARDFVASLPDGYAYIGSSHTYVLPVFQHLVNASVVDIARLRYRPKTKRTAAWFGLHTDNCRKALEAYRGLANRQLEEAC
jgi:hypothetical protein